jgi:uncharacterized protein
MLLVMLTRTGRLEGRRAVVTGASSGIGWYTALAFARAGADVVLVARRADRLADLARVIEDETGRRAETLSVDLSVRGAAAAAAQEILSGGVVDVLVNNAGSAVGGSIWAVADRDEARSAFEVDLWSPLAFIGAFVPPMRRRGDGTVVNVTSLRQSISWPSFGHSSAAKSALAQITETLRLELARHGVDVVEVIPGPIETPAQGPTKLVPGITEAIHARFGTAEPDALADRIVRAVLGGEPRVFLPDSVADVYEHPGPMRRQLAVDARDLLGASELGDVVDTLVVGADDPMIEAARQEWEDARRVRLATEAAS